MSEPERGSATVKWLNDWLDSQIEGQRRKNDSDLPELETAKLRGRIQAFNALKEKIKPYVL